jgi:hypothetical protein
MTVFMVKVGWFYDDSNTLGIYTDKDVAIQIAKDAYSKQDIYNDDCYDFANVFAVTLDTPFDSNNKPVFAASKDD